MIIKNRALWLAGSFPSSRYNHRTVIITLKASSFENGSQICWFFGVGNWSIILFSPKIINVIILKQLVECSQSVKVCHLHVTDGVSGHLASMLLISLDHCFQRILPICQSVSFACDRRDFGPFGINAAHFAGSLFLNNTANLSKCVICMWQTGFQAIWHQCCSFRWIIEPDFW